MFIFDGQEGSLVLDGQEVNIVPLNRFRRENGDAGDHVIHKNSENVNNTGDAIPNPNPLRESPSVLTYNV